MSTALSDTPTDLKELAEEAARQWMQTFAHPGALSLERIIEGYLLRQKADFEARIGALRHLSEQDKAELADALKDRDMWLADNVKQNDALGHCIAAKEEAERDAQRWAWWCYCWLKGGDQFNDMISDWEYETRQEFEVHVDTAMQDAKDEAAAIDEAMKK